MRVASSLASRLGHLPKVMAGASMPIHEAWRYGGSPMRLDTQLMTGFIDARVIGVDLAWPAEPDVADCLRSLSAMRFLLVICALGY